MKLLGIDYGDKHLGLAMADSETKLASPWQIIGNDIGVLKKIIAGERIEKIVVGWPMNLAGKENSQSAKTKKFVELLKNNFDIPIEAEDERLSTVSANKLIRESRKRGERDDSVAAMLILQSYLDKNFNKGY